MGRHDKLEKPVRREFYITEQTREMIKAIATHNDISVSKQIRELIIEKYKTIFGSKK